jgi:hypothetical protein
LLSDTYYYKYQKYKVCIDFGRFLVVPQFFSCPSVNRKKKAPQRSRGIAGRAALVLLALTIDHSQILYKPNIIWLVVSTPLKNISQWEGLSHI